MKKEDNKQSQRRKVTNAEKQKRKNKRPMRVFEAEPTMQEIMDRIRAQYP
jgi:hypothetical protein